MFLNFFSKENKTSQATTTIEEASINNIRNDMFFRQELYNIKNSENIFEKVSLAKDLLINSDFVVSQNILSVFDDDKCNNERNYFKKFLEYKDNISNIYKGVDCDVSLFCITMYVLLSSKLKLNNVSYQYGSKVKYEIKTSDMRFKGDTLTSALYPLKLYLGCLWKRIDGDDKLKKNKNYAEFYKLFDYVARTGIPVAPTGEWNEYCYKHSDIIWNAMDTPVKDFLRCYTMFGNYMRIPGNSYHIGGRMWTSFNMARSNKGKWDTIDTLLSKIYSYYKWNELKHLESIFTVKQEEIGLETLKWLNEYNDWDEFLNENCLYPFVDANTLIPISMKTGKIIRIDELKEYDATPKNYQEFLIFFEQLSKRIILRNESIYDKLSLNK